MGARDRNVFDIQAAPAAQFQKNKWPNQKMGQRTKQAFILKAYSWSEIIDKFPFFEAKSSVVASLSFNTHMPSSFLLYLT